MTTLSLNPDRLPPDGTWFKLWETERGGKSRQCEKKRKKERSPRDEKSELRARTGHMLRYVISIPVNELQQKEETKPSRASLSSCVFTLPLVRDKQLQRIEPSPASNPPCPLRHNRQTVGLLPRQHKQQTDELEARPRLKLTLSFTSFTVFLDLPSRVFSLPLIPTSSSRLMQYCRLRSRRVLTL